MNQNGEVMKGCHNLTTSGITGLVLIGVRRTMIVVRTVVSWRKSTGVEWYNEGPVCGVYPSLLVMTTFRSRI